VSRARAVFITLLIGHVFGSAPLAQAAAFVVDRTTDGTDAAPGDGVCATSSGGCTLRAAIQEANALPGTDTITLPAGTYLLAIPGRQENGAATGDLDVTDTVTITGAGASATIVDAAGVDRAFDVYAPVMMSGMSIRGGDPGPDGDGGAIFNGGTLTLSGVVLTGNHAGVSGGGLGNDNDATLIDVTLADNTAELNGGGMDNNGTATLRRVAVVRNMAGSSGGGLSNDSELTLENVTVSGNQAAFSGGGITNNGTATHTAVTLADNTSSSGGALQNIGDVTLAYVILASGTSGGTCTSFGTLTSGGSNVETEDACGLRGSRDRVGTDPLLGPLDMNGGMTPSHALRPGSPAIDAGGRDCPPPAVDQRGMPRPADGDGDGIATCDSGAYELVPDVPPLDARLDRLRRDIEAAVPAGLRDALTTMLTSAAARLAAAEQAIADGNTRAAKALLKKVARLLGRVARKLRTRKVRAGVPADVRKQLRAETIQLKRDVVALRRSL